MMPDEQEIFLEAADLSKSERAEFLAEACGDDAKLKRSVEKLLATISDDESILEKAAIPPTAKHTSPIPPSRIGDYVIKEEIARGAMGVVYRAEQVSLGRTVALKMIRPSILTSETEIARFRAEAQTAAGIDDPNIVPVYEVGEVDGQHYFSMRLIEGGTLRDRLDEFAGHPKKAAQLVAKVARAVQSAHRHGVLHRDLKPGNILIDETGEPHVMDFGIARSLDSESDLTQTGQIVGTLNYMPPEQARSESHLTTAADVYGLGAILYQLITGKPPHQGETSLQILKAISEEEPERPTIVVSALDRDLETIALKCLEKNPEKRYGTANDLADELERWLAGKPIEARPVRIYERLAKWMRRKPVHAGFAATAFLFLLTLAIGGPLVGLRQAKLKEATEKQLYFAEMNAASEALRSRVGFPTIRARLDRVKPPEDEHSKWEWRFLNRMTSQDPVRFRHGFPEGLSTHLDWSPDGSMIAVVGRDPAAHIFSPQGKLIREIETSRGEKRVAFNLDGTLLAIAFNYRVVVITTESWSQLVKRQTEMEEMPGMAWHPQNPHKFAIAGSSGRIQVWDLNTSLGNRRMKLLDLEPFEEMSLVGDLCLSPDGSQIAVAGKSGVTLVIDASTGEIAKKLKQRTMVNAVDWKRDSESQEFFTADGIDRRRVTWNSKDWQSRTVSEGHLASVMDIKYSPDGMTVATASKDGTVNIYASHRRDRMKTLFGHEGPLYSLDWRPDGGAIAATGGDGFVVVHPVGHHEDDAMWSYLIDEKALRIGIHPQGTFAAIPKGKEIEILSLRNRKTRILPLNLENDIIHATAWSPDGNSIVAVTTDTLLHVSAETGEDLGQIAVEDSALNLAFSPDGSRLAFTDGSKKLRWTDLGEKEPVVETWESSTIISETRWSPDSSKILVVQGNKRPAILLNPDTKLIEWEIPLKNDSFDRGAFHPHEDLVALGKGRRVYLFRASDGAFLKQFGGLVGSVRSLQWNSIGDRMLIEINRPNPSQIWDPVAGRKLIDLPMWQNQIRQIQWTPDGERILILERYHLRVMSAVDG